MAKLSRSQQIAEITVRVIVAALQVLAIVGGALLLALYPEDVSDDSNTADEAVGGVTITVGSLILIYEIIMIIFAAVNMEGANHSARLLVDIILKVVLAVLTILATLGVFVLAVILFIVLFAFGSVVVAVFAVPIGLGVLYTIAFIVSAVTSGIILSRLNSPATNQPAQIVMAPPQTVLLVPAQQPGIGQPPSYQYPPTVGQYQQTAFSGDKPAGPQYQAGYPVSGGYGQLQESQNPNAEKQNF